MLSQDYDKIVIFYNKFKSAIATELQRCELLSKKKFEQSFRHMRLYETKDPDSRTQVHALYDLYISSNLYHAQL